MWEMVAALAYEGVAGVSSIVCEGAVRRGCWVVGKRLSGMWLKAMVVVSGELVGRGAAEAATVCGGAFAGMEKASEAPKYGRGWVTFDTLVFEALEGDALVVSWRRGSCWGLVGGIRRRSWELMEGRGTA